VILPADIVKELQQIPVVSVVVAECVNADDSNKMLSYRRETALQGAL